MTVEVLRLSGLETDDALNEAEKLLDTRAGGPRQLRRLLVIDDVGRLVEHEPVYHRLESGRRVWNMLCVAAGSLTSAGGTLSLPESLGGSQGTGVIWVGDELGIDWRFAAPIADGHVGGRVGGLDHLVELLEDDDLFERVHDAFANRIPGKVASPGLWLAGADAEDATFAAALALAVKRISQPGPGTAGPFAELLPDAAGGATLAPAGRLARDRNEVTEWVTAATKALGKSAGLGRLIGRGSSEFRDHVIEAGAFLGGLRDHVAQLLRDAADRPADHQYRLIEAAGIQFPPGAAGRTARDATESPVYRAVARAIGSGDTLPFVLERLQVTERGLERKGSASYLPEVELKCPQQLLNRLANPPQRLPKPAAGGRTDVELPLDAARRSADALTDLAITVANREWSPATPSAADVARVRIALSSAAKTLASAVPLPSPGAGDGTRRAPVASRAESLRPVLCDLILRVAAAACGARGATGTQSRTAASELTAELLREWREHVHDNGMSEPPPFAAADGIEIPALDASGDAADIREAVLYGPDGEMWQLCLPDDLGALNLSAPPHVLRFAPRQNRDALGGTVPADTVWTSSGAYAGLIRLVPLQDRLVSSQWRDTDLHDQPRGR
jgi:hypothetical protein